ncbi:MAG: tetratricopeptide repeat protein [Deltaproteobacteria bacterium]|nr:tetratricopeptide repeat protein [Deltaproteobacteria bacterium]MBW2139644.1 tetratricopeptide repeat protein [Deltaproteobacteria bacterium]MBW2322138.1 tetratricopeptide repeat protein [Deltaproteobacteria bacterium]
MKKSNVIIAVFIAFVLGFVSGLLWAAFKGSPPGLAPMAKVDSSLAPGPSSDEVQRTMAFLEKRIQKDPNNFEALIEAGNFSFDHDLYDKAKKYYGMALKISPNEPDVLTDLGITYRRTGDSKKAISLFKQARKVDPSHQNSAMNLGIVLFHDLKDKKGALEAWEDYLALNPKDDRAEMIRKVVNQLRGEP